MASEIVSYLQTAKHRFGDFAKISYRLSGTSHDGASVSDCFLWEANTLKSIERIYVRVAIPHTTRIFDITPQLVKIQRALRKHRRK